MTRNTLPVYQTVVESTLFARQLVGIRSNFQNPLLLLNLCMVNKDSHSVWTHVSSQTAVSREPRDSRGPMPGGASAAKAELVVGNAPAWRF
jgi:hypothetical protein